MATTPRIADIGAVPDGLGEDLTRFLQQVQRLLRTGVQTGGISGSGSGSSSSGGGATIIGGGTSGGGLTGMDDPTPPPTPSGVTVDAGLSYVFFETAAPVFTMGAGYDRTRVYIAQYPASAPTPPTFGDAVLAYEFVGQIGAMPAEPATRMCVWLKWRTKAGYDSTTPAGGINGFIVETGQDVELLLKALTGSITSGELHSALGARIDLVDGPASLPGSVAARISSEAQTRQDADAAIASSVTTLQSRVDSGNAAPFDPLQSWEFEGSVDGWSASGAVLTSLGQSVRLASSSSDPIMLSPVLAIVGATNNKVRLRINRVAGADWQGTLYYSTAGHGYSESYRKTVPAPAPGWNVIEWDMEELTAGGSDWLASTITAIRLDLGTSPSDTFDIDWVSVGKRSVGISRSSVDAAIQVEATTRATVDGHAASLYTVRTSLTSGGRTVVGGFGLSGTSSATSGATIDFGVRADRFWIGPPNDGSAPGVGDILPFIVQATPTTINGLAVPAGVYINDAFIRNGTITNAKIGNAAIDDAKIANLSAAKITAGSLAVGQYIQSSNYIAGTQGWRINSDGSAQFMAANIAGQLTAGQIDTRGLSIKDGAGNVILAAGSSLPISYAPSGTKNSEVSFGTNLLYNDCFEEGIQGWDIGDNLFGAPAIFRVVNLSDSWRLLPIGSKNGSVQYVQQSGTDANVNAYCDILSDPVQVEPGSRYIVSVFTGSSLCEAHLFSYFYNGSGAVVGNSYGSGDYINGAIKGGGNSLSDYKRLHSIADIPAGAQYIRLVVRKLNTFPGGYLGSYVFFTRAQVERVGSDAINPGPWSPSGISNPSSVRNNNPITPANVSTYIASAAIGSAQIADLSVSDAKVGNYIKSYNFNGTIDPSGNVTNVGTVGWALGRAGVMVVDAAHIRGRLTASQVSATTLTAITANLGNVTAGTLSNSDGSTFIDMNATGSQILLRAGQFNYGTGRYPVQVTADGEALFTKQVASGSWSGNVIYFKREASGNSNTVTQTSGVIVIDTGYNYPYGQSINRDFVARVSTFTSSTSGGALTTPGQYDHAVSIGLSARRGIALFANGAPQNQSSGIFGPYNDRIYIFMDVGVIHDALPTTAFTRSIVSVSWQLLLGV